MSDRESLIPRGQSFKGTITGPGSLKVDGSLRGDVRIEGTLEVSQTGRVHGEVRARRLVLAGRCDGLIRATEHLRVTPTGHLIGIGESAEIQIDEGACVDGDLRGPLSPGHDEVKPAAVTAELRGRGTSRGATQSEASAGPRKRVRTRRRQAASERRLSLDLPRLGELEVRRSASSDTRGK